MLFQYEFFALFRYKFFPRQYTPNKLEQYQRVVALQYLYFIDQNATLGRAVGSQSPGRKYCHNLKVITTHSDDVLPINLSREFQKNISGKHECTCFTLL